MLAFCLLIVSLIHGSSQFQCIPRLKHIRQSSRNFCCDYDRSSNQEQHVLNWRAGLKESFLDACKSRWNVVCNLTYVCGVRERIRDAFSAGLRDHYRMLELEKLNFLVVKASVINPFTDGLEGFRSKFRSEAEWYKYRISSRTPEKENLQGGQQLDRLCPVLGTASYFGCDLMEVTQWKTRWPEPDKPYMYICLFDSNAREDCSWDPRTETSNLGA